MKLLREVSADALYRFKAEFRALTDLTHPNLISLYELVCENDQWFFTMELIEGSTFLEYVSSDQDRSSSDDTPTAVWDRSARGPERVTLPPPRESALDQVRLRRALRQLADGLATLHRAGKLHRDIKPANVLVSRDERLVLLDFGLSSDLLQSTTGQEPLAGTPEYMAPEHAFGSATEASDWYSVGVILYQALTGRLPFERGGVGALLAKMESDPPLPRDVAAGVPGDLSDLCMQLLHRDPALRASAPQILAAVQPVNAPASEPASIEPAFVGRTAHLAFLQEAFRNTTAGQPSLVYLHGPSGMGKTRLARRFFELIATSTAPILLSGRCYERESVPYKALDDLIDSLTRLLRSFPPELDLLPDDTLHLARLFPVLRQIPAVAQKRRIDLEPPDPRELRRRASRAFAELLRRLARKAPLVIFIDDVQWGDADSAQLLSEMLTAPSPPVVTVIVAYRTEQAHESAFLRTLETSLPRRGSGKKRSDIRELIVDEMSEAETFALTADLLAHGDPEVEPMTLTRRVGSIVRETGGNPFFVSELVQFLQMRGHLDTKAMTLDSVIRARLEALPADSRLLLEVISVAGKPVSHAVARSASGLAAEYKTAIGHLRAHHWIREKGVREYDEVENYHQRVREAIVNSLSADRCREIHSRLAIALITAGDLDPDALADHFRSAGDLEEALQHTREAAHRAEDALAFDRAADLYALALDLAPEDSSFAGLRQSAAEALANAGRGYAAAEMYLAAAEVVAPAQALDLRRLAAEQFLRAGHVDRGMSTLASVLRRFDTIVPATTSAAVVSLLFRRALLRLRGLWFRPVDVSAVPPAQLTKLDAFWSASIGLGLIDTVRGADFQTRHLLLALQCGEIYRVARAVALEAGYSAAGGSKSRGRTARLLRKAQDLAGRAREPHARGLVTMMGGIAATLEGRWHAAIDYCREAQTILQRECRGVAWENFNSELYELIALLWLGQIEQLNEKFPVLFRTVQERRDLFAETYLRSRFSWFMRLLADQPAQALREAESSTSKWSKRGFHIQHYQQVMGRCEVAIYAGDPREGLTFALDAHERLRQSLLLHVQIIRIEWTFLRGRLEIAASSSSPDTERLLKAALKSAREIERTKAEWGSGLAAILRAGVSHQLGRTEQCLQLLDLAERALTRSEMTLHARAVQIMRGKLAPHGEATVRAEAAEAALRGLGVKNPERLAAALVPGF